MNSVKRSNKYQRLVWITLCGALVMVLIVAGGGLFAAKEPPVGNPPVFEDSFAVTSLWPGQDWHIFVKGSDAQGQMDYIWVIISQAGGNMWMNDIIRLKGDERKSFAGYLNLPTPHFFPQRSWEYVKVEMRIKDTAGRYSNVRVHELEIGSPTKEIVPAEWQKVANRQLGTIFFDFNLDQAGSSGFRMK